MRTRRFKDGEQVRVLQNIRTCLNGGSLLVEKGSIGTITSSFLGSCSVEFVSENWIKERYGSPLHIWFSEEKNEAQDYPSPSTLESVSPPDLEGQSFTIISDNGDGTYLVRRT